MSEVSLRNNRDLKSSIMHCTPQPNILNTLVEPINGTTTRGSGLSRLINTEYFMDYRISYIYPEEERDKVEVAVFPLRLVSQDELTAMIEDAEEAGEARIKPVTFFDRSIFIGRHMDTGDYNKNCPKLRGAVNSLFEGYVRTDLQSLFVDYVPRPGFDHLNNLFRNAFYVFQRLS